MEITIPLYKKLQLVPCVLLIILMNTMHMNTSSGLIANDRRDIEQDDEGVTEYEAPELSRAEEKRLDSLPRPPVSSKEIVQRLRKEKMINSKELYDGVSWYVYHRNDDVIRQLIANMPHEVDVVLPEEEEYDDYTGLSRLEEIMYRAMAQDAAEANVPPPARVTEKAEFLGPLNPSWITPNRFGPILHRELLAYTRNKNTDPHLIFLLLSKIRENDPIFKGRWYTLQMQTDDILAYLRIHAHYPEWPTILSLAKEVLMSITYDWWDYDTIQEVLKTAQQEGAEVAYSMYLDRFRTNSHKGEGRLDDLRHPGRYFRVENTFRGWCSEDVSGRLIIYDVNVPDALIGVPDVDKIVSVERDGEDVTGLCMIRDYRLMEDLMVIPLRQAPVVKIDYKIHVTHKWWPGPSLWNYFSADPKAKPLELDTIDNDPPSY